MRNGHQNNKHQHHQHRMRGRNRGGGKSHNPLTRVYESNGPDVKIRGTANHIAEKYIQLARDATASGDPVAAENYYQHAEHYFRLIATAQEQLRQNQPFQQQPRPEGGDVRQEESFDENDENAQPQFGGEPHSPREHQQNYAQQQPYQRDQQPRQDNRHQHDNRQQNADAPEGSDVDRLPSFITGNQPQPNAGNGQQNGHDGQGDRFPHRRRRRGHRSPRPDMAGGAQGEGSDDTAPSGE
jgi:hypothetical protein